MHVAAVQHDIVWQEKDANHRTVEAMLAAAALPRGTFVVLPELGDSGFSFDLEAIVDDRTLPWAADLARRLEVWLQVGHARRGKDGRGRNCATIVDPLGAVAGTYEKVHPFTYGREGERYTGGDRLLLEGGAGPVVCPMICYDLRFPELWRLAALHRGPPGAAELFTAGASWPAPRHAHWRALLVARAIENQAFVVGVNRVGSDPNHDYAGGSIVVGPDGTVLAEAGDAPAVIEADLDLRALRRWRREFPALGDARRELLGAIAGAS